MSDQVFRFDRRTLMAGLAVTALAGNRPARADGSPITIRCKPTSLRLREKEPATDLWSIGDQALRFKRGDRLDVALTNDLPVSSVLNWRGIDGIATLEPLLARSALTSSASDKFQIALRHAGTYFCDAALVGDGAARPSRGLPLIVSETEAVAIDRDETLLIEGFRLKADGSAIAPGLDPVGTTAIYTINGELKWNITVRSQERLRLRFINALQRHVIALKFERHVVTMMALDGEPAEPFLARNGTFALAPGGRADVFVDIAPGTGTTQILMHDGEAARPIGQFVVSDEAPKRPEKLPLAPPLPSNGLPVHLDLKSALRVDLAFGGEQKDWQRPAVFAASSAPVFRAKTGRIVVLSLTNRASTTSVFHLHGHHFRLLDRLDDGWKPFWLDTIAIDAGQTLRIAFAAEFAGRWLMEAADANWSSPKLLRWFSVE